MSMKIDQLNFPIVFKVKSGNYIPSLSQFSKCEVEYITKPFNRVLDDFKFASMHLTSQLNDCQGIILFSKSQYFYKLSNHQFTLIHYNQEYPLARLYGCIHQDGTFSFNEDNRFFNKSLVSDMADQDTKYTWGIVEFLFRYLCFKQFADIEIYIISTNKPYGYKSRKVIGEEVYETDSKFPIKVVDSKYIRTLIRSGQFKVSGHFRLQPYGIGKQNLRLIWVSEHVREKHNILKKSL